MDKGQKIQREPNEAPRGELAAPPRFLFWLVIGLFLLAIIGSVSGVLVFRNVLRPGQQQRVIDMLPFMSAFLDRPDPNTTLPTVAPNVNTGGPSAEDLLNMPLVTDETEEASAPAEMTELPVSLLPTATTAPTDTPTPFPTIAPTATLEPTSEPSFTVADLSGVRVAQAQAAPEEEEVIAEEPAAEQPQTVSMSVPLQARLYGFTHVEQTWNNCGPANITMALSYFSWQGSQEEAARFLKPDREDKNVNPSEMVAFVNENTGVKAITRIGGSMELLKQFIAAGHPVIIETGYAPEGYDWIGHYRTVVGYDDGQQLFYVYDSYLGSGQAGEGLSVPYDQFDRDWQAFNRVFIVIYLRENEAEVARILGELADPVQAAEHALLVAQQEARANPQNQYAWFNMGTALAKLGRYTEAAAAYDRATQIGLNFRMLWYQFGMYETYFNVGRYDDVMAFVNANLNNGGEYVEETHYWQGRVLAAQGRTSEAAAAFNRALRHNPRFTAAQEALNSLSA